MSWGSLNYASPASPKLEEEDNVLLEPTITIFEQRPNEDLAPEAVPDTSKINGEKRKSSNLQQTLSKNQIPDTAQETSGNADDDEQQDIGPEARQASVKTLLKAQETADSSRTSFSKRSSPDIDPLSVGSRSVYSTTEANNIEDKGKDEEQAPGKSISGKFLKKHPDSGGATTTSSVRSFMARLSEWSDVPVISVSKKSLRKSTETKQTKVEAKSAQTEPSGVPQQKTEPETGDLTKNKSGTDPKDDRVDTKRASTDSKSFFEKLRSQLDAIKEDAEEEESENKNKPTSSLSPTESETSSDVVSLPITETSERSSTMSVTSSIFDMIRQTVEERKKSWTTEEDHSLKLETPVSTRPSSRARSRRTSTSTMKSAISRKASVITSDARSRHPSVAKFEARSRLAGRRKSAVSFRDPIHRERSTTESTVSSFQGPPEVNRDESILEVSATHDRFTTIEVEQAHISGDFKPLDSDMASLQYTMDGSIRPGLDDMSFRSYPRESLIDRQLYTKLFEISHIRYMNQIMVNNYLHTKLAEYYKDRKMFFVIAPDKSAVQNKKKYIKHLNAFDALRHKDEIDTISFTDEIYRLEVRHRNIKERITELYEEFQDEIIKYASTLSGKDNFDKIMERFIRRQNTQMDLSIQMRRKFMRMKNRMYEKYDDLQKLDRLGPGFTIMDYHQLRVDNRTLSDRHDEQEFALTKVRKSCRHYLQILAHRREKLECLDLELAECQERLKEVQYDYQMARIHLDELRQERKVWRAKFEDLTAKVGILVNPKLFYNNYKQTIHDVESINTQLREKKDNFRAACRQVLAVRKNIETYRELRKRELEAEQVK